jgi:prevent-host-death family protein
MTERIAHRDLRNRSAEILRNVAAGESYEITNHGEVVATLSPPDHGGPALRVRPAKRRGGWSDIKPVSSEESIQDILDELRSERG